MQPLATLFSYRQHGMMEYSNRTTLRLSTGCEQCELSPYLYIVDNWSMTSNTNF
jgi:hypothetical protein